MTRGLPQQQWEQKAEKVTDSKKRAKRRKRNKRIDNYIDKRKQLHKERPKRRGKQAKLRREQELLSATRAHVPLHQNAWTKAQAEPKHEQKKTRQHSHRVACEEPDMLFVDAHKMLKLEPPTTLLEVKRAFQKQIMAWHPDQHFGDDNMELCVEKTQQITQAYDFLKSVYSGK